MPGEIELIVLTLFIIGFFYAAGTTLFILMAGKVGMFAVKRKLPALFPSGTIVVKGYESGYVEIDFATYKSEWKWGSIFGPKDKRVTHTGKPTNKEKGTGIPVLFLKEGESQNVDLFGQREPEKGSAWLSEILSTTHSAGYNMARDKFEKNDNYALYALILGLITVVLLIVVAAISFGEYDLLSKVGEQLQAVQLGVESLKSVPRIE